MARAPAFQFPAVPMAPSRLKFSNAFRLIVQHWCLFRYNNSLERQRYVPSTLLLMEASHAAYCGLPSDRCSLRTPLRASPLPMRQAPPAQWEAEGLQACLASLIARPSSQMAPFRPSCDISSSPMFHSAAGQSRRLHPRLAILAAISCHICVGDIPPLPRAKRGPGR